LQSAIMVDFFVFYRYRTIGSSYTIVLLLYLRFFKNSLHLNCAKPVGSTRRNLVADGGVPLRPNERSSPCHNPEKKKEQIS